MTVVNSLLIAKHELYRASLQNRHLSMLMVIDKTLVLIFKAEKWSPLSEMKRKLILVKLYLFNIRYGMH